MRLHAGFHSCNGLSVNSDREKWGTPHLWQDVLNTHARQALHALVGGGDQIYNDAVWKCPALTQWLDISNTEVSQPLSLPLPCTGSQSGVPLHAAAWPGHSVWYPIQDHDRAVQVPKSGLDLQSIAGRWLMAAAWLTGALLACLH